jgi:tRNA(Ile)-lysidine synthase
MKRESTSIEAAYDRAWPPAEWRDVHVVLAVSGGADSVAMLRAALVAKQRAGGRGRLHVAHLNHGLRGAEATADARWVAELCRRLDVPLELGQADVAAAAAEQGDGWESAARSARYDFIRETAERLGARFVAVAHTADDQVETTVHRLIRGTGLAGMAGMPQSRPLSSTVSLVRPLLAVRRAEVRRYLHALGQDFREDSTNVDGRFTRNRLRHELLPLVRAEFNADVDEAILRLARQAGEAQQVISQLARRLTESNVETTYSCAENAPAECVRIAIGLLADEPELVVREICKAAWTNAGWPLQEMGFAQWQQLAELIVGGERGKSAIFPGGIRAERLADSLVLRSIREK